MSSVLVVAAHPSTRDAIVSLAAAKGYDADALDCDDELMKRLRFGKPSVVILDCGVPDSFDVLDRIRGDALARATPVVVFSTEDENLRERALLRGAAAYVPKASLDWAELFVEIQRFAGPPSESQDI